MPANITITGGKAEMAYYGETPWHGLGTEVDHAMTSAEVIDVAGLDWPVKMLPVYIQDRTGAYHEIPNRKAATRADTGQVFGVMSNAYRPLQNRESCQMLDGIVANGEAVFHTVGSLDGGRKVWFLMKLPGDLKVSDKDILQKYVLLANSHDGSLAVHMKVVGMRVVCQNTLDIALGEGGRAFKARHTKGIFDKINDAREALGLAEAYFEMMMRGIERMANTMVQPTEAKEMLTRLYGPELKAGEEPGPRIATHIRETMALTINGRGQELDGARGTAWGLYNSVTDYVDHGRGPGQSQEKRLNSIWYGSGGELKRRAWEMLVTA